MAFRYFIHHCSDVGSKWRLLYSLLHPTTEHLNRLIGDILSSPAPESMADSSQLTQGGSKVRRSCQSIVGAVCAELRHSDRNLRTAWFEKGDFKIGFFKKHWMNFYHYRMDVYTHFQHTFMFKQHVKWILHPMTPLTKHIVNQWYHKNTSDTVIFIHSFIHSFIRFSCLLNHIPWTK